MLCHPGQQPEGKLLAPHLLWIPSCTSGRAESCVSLPSLPVLISRCIIVIKAWCNYSSWQVVKGSVTALQCQVAEQQRFPPKACSHPHPKAKTHRKWSKLHPFCCMTACVSVNGRQKSQGEEKKENLVCSLKKHCSREQLGKEGLGHCWLTVMANGLVKVFVRSLPFRQARNPSHQ